MAKSDLCFAAFAADVATFTWYSDIDPITSCASNLFKNYCQKLLLITQVSSSVILLALKYIQRVKATHPQLQGQPGSEIRIFTMAVLLANKYLDDKTFHNQFWSNVAGIPVEEITRMEVEFLASIQYHLYVSKEEYFAWLKFLEHFIVVRNQQLRRLKIHSSQHVPPNEPLEFFPDYSDHCKPLDTCGWNSACQVRLFHSTKLLHTDSTHPLIS
ncbi:hypothetical protein K493DRAFT_317048 [Basidiobolus meristosporus CBS 931.73]|uniref:Cyclin N-terminal domain-containing protein n=1 Tax=Basidiobolus meristosporus CBS 931.73 TaxID=1314790 RepID=A0A1Y1Y1G3_9FUNG|nr:hypothetical protein K493DRAFT_317048 [Basidiobolus meristosporus CBS 931.73]|eukprot:ORX91789.1 hypothetical protein K493DRAFT_317048 [Basidiobolus meristosporus CBS 931.73]